MVYEIVSSPDFDRQAKRLAKHYPSFKSDFLLFLDSLRENPYQGTELGGGIRKIRMQITSKGKGKSAGTRVITMNINIDVERLRIALVYMYDKSEAENVKDSFLKRIIGDLKL